MATASVKDRIQHVLRSIDSIEGYWAGKSFADFEGSEPFRAATERHLLIIAEAVKHIPDADKAKHADIPWRDIVGIGNILRHGYDVVDERRVWEVVQSDLDQLKTAVTAITADY